MDSNFYVISVAKTLRLSGTFGVSTNDQFRFVRDNEVDCSNSSDKLFNTLNPERAVSLTGRDANGGGFGWVDVMYHDIEPATKPLKLCYRFGRGGPALLFVSQVIVYVY